MKSRIPDGSTPRVAERRSRSGVILLMTMVIPLTAAMCWSKDSNFFEPEPLDATLLPDLDAPIYGQIRPIQGVGVLNSNVLSFTLNDPAGTNGAVPSGIDPPTVSARLANGTAIPLSANGVNYTGSFSTIPDGALTVSLSAKDKAGNTGTGSLSFSLDRTAPNVALTTTPATTATSEADSVRYTVGGTVADPHLSTARLLVTQPGTDAACGTADDVAWPQGSSGGQVSQNTFDLTADVVASGQFSRTFTTYNGVAPGGASRIAVYCGLLEAFDTGKDENGVDKRNRGAVMWRSELTWSRPATSFDIVLGTRCQHFSGFSFVFLDVSTTPAQANLGYTATVTGPSGGLIGTGNHSGNLNAQGQATIQQTIQLFGTYNWSLTAGGVTRTASKVVNSSSC